MTALQDSNGSNLVSKNWLREKTRAFLLGIRVHTHTAPARLSLGELRAVSLPGLQISSEEPTRKQEGQGAGDGLEEMCV